MNGTPDQPRILVVDDRPANVELLEASLVPRGYRVLVASSGAEALEQMRMPGQHHIAMNTAPAVFLRAVVDFLTDP